MASTSSTTVSKELLENRGDGKSTTATSTSSTTFFFFRHRDYFSSRSLSQVNSTCKVWPQFTVPKFGKHEIEDLFLLTGEVVDNRIHCDRLKPGSEGGSKIAVESFWIFLERGCSVHPAFTAHLEWLRKPFGGVEGLNQGKGWGAVAVPQEGGLRANGTKEALHDQRCLHFRQRL